MPRDRDAARNLKATFSFQWTRNLKQLPGYRDRDTRPQKPWRSRIPGHRPGLENHDELGPWNRRGGRTYLHNLGPASEVLLPKFGPLAAALVVPPCPLNLKVIRKFRHCFRRAYSPGTH
jgi:hypothetical protein